MNMTAFRSNWNICAIQSLQRCMLVQFLQVECLLVDFPLLMELPEDLRLKKSIKHLIFKSWFRGGV